MARRDALKAARQSSADAIGQIFGVASDSRFFKTNVLWVEDLEKP